MNGRWSHGFRGLRVRIWQNGLRNRTQDVEKHKIGVFGNFDFSGQKVNADVTLTDNADVMMTSSDWSEVTELTQASWLTGLTHDGRKSSPAARVSHARSSSAEKCSKWCKSDRNSQKIPNLNLPWRNWAPNTTELEESESLAREWDGSNGLNGVDRRSMVAMLAGAVARDGDGKDVIFINQAKYIKEKLKKFGVENVKPEATPISSSTKLDKDEEGKCVDSKLYRSMIGSLFYLTASRPDIMFSVCLCARFQANPRESHLKAVKRIFRYLQDTPSLGLWYPRDSTFDLHAYSDADYGGCEIDRKSTSAKMTIWCIAYRYWMNQYRYPYARANTDSIRIDTRVPILGPEYRYPRH
ncbi:hypothetical protein V6N12_047158 [Hibiscus sabdariffa]|uniref:Uncharacterized protein n=1 Tax=Hibiscus sabdariffa TaxID=183260 RepID=A0ABR2DA25_9ROSI